MCEAQEALLFPNKPTLRPPLSLQDSGEIINSGQQQVGQKAAARKISTPANTPLCALSGNFEPLEIRYYYTTARHASVVMRKQMRKMKRFERLRANFCAACTALHGGRESEVLFARLLIEHLTGPPSLAANSHVTHQPLQSTHMHVEPALEPIATFRDSSSGPIWLPVY